MTLLHREPHSRPLLVAFATLLTMAAVTQFPVASRAQVPTVAEPVGGQEEKQVEDLLAYADLLFSREQFAVAAQQYLIFIQENPESPNLQAAWFRLGECYLKVNQIEDAESSFNFLIGEFKRGPFVGSAAYRLAVMRLNDKDYRNALSYFQVARDELTDPDAKLLASFYCARSLQLTEQPREALAEFEKVIEAKAMEENPYHERSLLESARLYFDLGDAEKALERFASLAEIATTQEYREEATVRGGLLAGETGDSELSDELLGKALRFSDTSPWKALAHVGAIFNAFAAGDYERVIGLYNTGAYTPPDESRARVLLVVGHSHRIQGNLDDALRLYALVEGRYPAQPEGIEAGYRRLQILHQQGDESLPRVAAEFAEKQRSIDPESSFIDMAWLMAAEWHFTKAETSASGAGSEFATKHYTDAAAAYKRVRPSNIEEKYREKALYKLAWSEIESGNPQDGILSLTRFIQEHPDSEFVSSALAKRAVAYQTREDHEFALGDYLDIQKKFPEAPEREFALQQIALIYAHQRKTEEMIEAYHNLLEEFPNTDGAGEAHYWIGVGHFDLEQHREAIPALEKARALDSEYDDQSTLRLVICHYQLENIPELAIEARRYLDNEPPLVESSEAPARRRRATIPRPVLEYLARKLAAEESHEQAEYFLTHVSDAEDPQKTSASVWKLLADTRMALKMHEGAVAAYDHYITQTERPSDLASAYLQRGIAQFCLRDFDAARNSAQESLRSQKEGRTNASARILLGDIASAQGDLEEAAREYLVVSQIFSDPEITPRSLSKAANAYRSLGNLDRAEQLKQQLSDEFPDYVEPASLDQDC